MNLFKSQSGQSLVEYLVLIALMGVATVGVVRALNQTVNAQFANAIYAIQGSNHKKAQTDDVDDGLFKKRDLSDFMNGAVTKKGNGNEGDSREK